MRIWLIFLAICLFSMKAVAQGPDTIKTSNKKDSLNRVRDSITSKPFVPRAHTDKIFHPDSLHSPHTAVMRSALIPGWGQLYNHEWYLVPIYYGAFATLGYFIVTNNASYHTYLAEAKRRQNGDAPSAEFISYTGGYQQFFDAASYSQRNFQLSILGVVGVWGINVIQAYISAKFIHSYTVDNNLSFKVTPGIINSPVYAYNNYGYIPSVKVTLAFR